MQMLLHPLELEIARPFRISRGVKTHQASLIVQLKEGDISAWGEAVAHPFFGADLDKMIAILEHHREQIESATLDDPIAFWSYMQPLLAEQAFALTALDLAVWDLWARKQKKSLRQALDLPDRKGPHSNITLGLDSIPELIANMDRFQWPIYKVKLGGEHDLASMQAIRQHTQSTLRVDANGGWTAQQCLEIAPELAKLGVEFIEQPLGQEDWEGMQQVFAQSPLPIIADESCQTEADVDRCAESFHGINIKLAKCGGITPALRMIKRGRELGLQMMMGCMVESRVGTSAIAQLLPLLDAVDMDGPINLKYQYAEGVEMTKDEIILPSEYGSGASLRPQFRSFEPV